MNDWTTQTLQFGAVTIIVHRPVLTEKERARREGQVTDAMTSAMRDYMKRKDQHHEQQGYRTEGHGRPQKCQGRRSQSRAG